MGLAGGIVRRVFSKSPCCSSAGTSGTSSRGHTAEKASADHHRRRWSSLRLYLCGEEMMNAAADEDDDDGETVSVKSFETTCGAMPAPEEAHVVPVAHRRLPTDAHDAVGNDDNPAGEPEDQSRVGPGGGEQSHGHVAVAVVVPARAREEEEEGAATLIQSAFRGFMARRELLRRAREEQEETEGAQQQEEPRSPTSASVATSVLVQVGESLSNLRLMSEETASSSVQQQQQRSSQSQQRSSRPPTPAPPPAFRVKEEWDDSTVSSNVSRMRIQSRIEATTRRERALAYAFSQQLRSCGGGGNGGNSKKRSAARADAEQAAEFNVGWSWLERWMATRQAAEPAADDCMSRNADTGSSSAAAAMAGRRVVVVRSRRRWSDVAVEEKESCGSNDVVSVVSFDGSSSLGGAGGGGGGGGGARSGGLSCHKPPGKSRLKGGRSLPRRKQVAASDHRLQARSHKVSKKGHQRVEQAPLHKDRLDAAAGFDFDDACQPPTDY